MAAYVILHNKINDPEAMGAYIPQAMQTMGPYGAELLVMSEESAVVEGSTEYPRTIVLKFESREKAEGWYNCAEYQKALPIRLGATEGYAVIVDEFDPSAM